MEDKDCDKNIIDKQTGVSIGLLLIVAGFIGTGIFLAGQMSADIKTNAENVAENRSSIQHISEQISDLPTRMEIQEMKENIKAIRDFLMDK
jgi:hypothetical protein